MKKILIGGKALNILGSSRSTSDTDYLIFDEKKELFIKDEKNNVDYINAAKSEFFKKIWEEEKNNVIASPLALLELKAYAFVQHCQNMNFQKADDAEYDMRFLVRKYDIDTSVVDQYLSSAELKEVKKIIQSTKR